MTKLRLGMALCLGPVAGLLLAFAIIVLGTIWPHWALAQDKPPPNAPGMKCFDMYRFSEAITVSKVAPSEDQDGDQWALAWNKPTGDWMLGFVKNSAMFCIVAQGKTGPQL